MGVSLLSSFLPGVLEFTSAADEEAANRRKEAALLLAVLPPGSLRVAGDGSSRIPAEAVGDPDERRLKRLDDLAGTPRGGRGCRP